MKKINLGDFEFERFEARPEGYRAGIACFGTSIGAAMSSRERNTTGIT